MTNSLLAAVHNAVVGAAADALDESETGAPALNTKGISMSEDTKPAGGTQTGISKAEHDAAVNAARADGKAEGEKAATERLAAALGAEGVKGDAGRMAAALDLAVKSPGMSGADVAAFVVANVQAAKPGTASTDYASQRAAAAGLAQPHGAGAPGNKSALADAVTATNKRR